MTGGLHRSHDVVRDLVAVDIPKGHGQASGDFAVTTLQEAAEHVAGMGNHRQGGAQRKQVSGELRWRG